MTTPEHERVKELKEAQTKAEGLFREVETRRLIRPGLTEVQLNEEIYALAKEMYGITKYWHKRIVRAGKNTLLPYDDNPPDLTIGDDDILFLDFGPVFEDWEADFGRTFVLGQDPVKSQTAGRCGAGIRGGQTVLSRTPRHHQPGAVCSRAIARHQAWLGIRRADSRPHHRPVSSRADPGRQGDALRPSSQFAVHALVGRARAGTPLDLGDPFRGSRPPDWRVLRRTAYDRLNWRRLVKAGRFPGE